tara:strand:+ start:378 stop:617 length:240 start_codon:yes stop_codon:yes gene_type:complete
MKKILLGLFMVTAVTGQTETRCFFTEVLVTVLITRCLYDICSRDCSYDYCDNHKLCIRLRELKKELEDLKHRVRYLEQR